MSQWKHSFIPSVAIAASAMAVLVLGARGDGVPAGTSDCGSSVRSVRTVAVNGKAEKIDLSPDIARLIGSTKSPDWRMRAQAARELGWKREQAAPAVPALIRLLGDKTLGESGEVSARHPRHGGVG